MSVTTRRRASALWVTIDRPGALNAIDFDVMEGLERALEQARAERDVRALVLRGAGERAFVSGGDLRAFADLRSEEDARSMASRMKAILDGFERIDCWTVACVNGDAYGGGCETLLAFDQVVAVESAHMGFTQARFRLTPGWGGLTRLIERVGRATALRWLATQARVSAPDALAAGLVDAVVAREELEDEVDRLVAAMGRQPRDLIDALKRGALEARERPRSAAIAAELERFAPLWAHDEHHARVDAFLEKKG